VTSVSATTRLLKANLHSHGRRYFSTGLAVAISTAFIVITLLFSNTMTSSLTGSVRNSYRGTTSVVTYSPADDEAIAALTRGAQDVEVSLVEHVKTPGHVAGDGGALLSRFVHVTSVPFIRRSMRHLPAK